MSAAILLMMAIGDQTEALLTQTTAFTVPPNVTSISLGAQGAGGDGIASIFGGSPGIGGPRGGGGGGACYHNNLAVTPGEVLQVEVTSAFARVVRSGTPVLTAFNGGDATLSSSGVGGGWSGIGGTVGFNGAQPPNFGNGGGAGGFNAAGNTPLTAAGMNGAFYPATIVGGVPQRPAGGGGGGNGMGRLLPNNSAPGSAGSEGSPGGSGGTLSSGADGGGYGGGGGGGAVVGLTVYPSGNGAPGAVKLLWSPGQTFG